MAVNQNRPIPPLSIRQIARFRKGIEVRGLSECWLWVGTIDEEGYGRYASFLSHCISYFLFTGIDPGDFVVCHSCDNPPCQNGNHLFLGTYADNVADMFAKKRAPRASGDAHYTRLHPEKILRGDAYHARRDPNKIPQGPQRHNAKFTWEQVEEIRARYKPYDEGPDGSAQLARRFGVTQTCILQIIWRKTYTKVGDSRYDSPIESIKPTISERFETVAARPNETFLEFLEDKEEYAESDGGGGPFRRIPVPAEIDMERYQSYLDMRGPDECWPWRGKLNARGYGIFSMRHAQFLAHRVSVFIKTGINQTNKGVHHSCDFPACNNPSHLFYGTQLENMRDMHAKGRNNQPKGESHCRSVLTLEQVKEIRSTCVPVGRRRIDSSPNGVLAIAIRYKVSRQAIYDILRGYTWK